MGRDSPLGEARARYTASVISGQATEILKDEYISWLRILYKNVNIRCLRQRAGFHTIVITIERREVRFHAK